MGNVILGLLMLRSATLYELGKTFERGVSLFYSASLGSIRAALARLLDRGFVSVREHTENGRNKKTYSITPTGRAEFERWMREPIRGSDLEVAAMSRIFFLGLLPRARRTPVLDGIVGELRRELAALEALAAELDGMELPTPMTEIFSPQRATLDYAVTRQKTLITWCERFRDDA